MVPVTFVDSIAATTADGQALVSLYERLFPEGERVPTDQLFLGGTGDKETGDTNRLLLGVKVGGTFAGFVNAEFMREVCGAFVGYLGVDERYRGQQLAEKLVRHLIETVQVLSERLSGGPADYLFTELDREIECHPNASKVRKFWARLGMMPIQGLSWEYPPLHEGEGPHAMDLASLPLRENRLRTTTDIRSVVLAIYKDVYGISVPDDRLRRVLDSIVGWPK